MRVWLTDWQLAEDHILIGVGEAVEWTLYPSDRAWTTRLFDDRLEIEWQYDTYGDAVPGPSLRVVARVTELQSVRCRQQLTAQGIEPARGKATLHSVTDTSGSWLRAEPPTSGLPATASREKMNGFSHGYPDLEADALYGYVASLALRD